MKVIGSIVFIALVIFNIRFYHKHFTVVYKNLIAGIGKELFAAIIIAAFEIAILVGCWNLVFGKILPIDFS